MVWSSIVDNHYLILYIPTYIFNKRRSKLYKTIVALYHLMTYLLETDREHIFIIQRLLIIPIFALLSTYLCYFTLDVYLPPLHTYIDRYILN